MGFSWAPLRSAARVAARGLALMLPMLPAGDMLALYSIARRVVALIKMDGGRGAGSDPMHRTLPRAGA